MGSYESLPSLIDEIIQAAIESDMLCQGFTGNMKSGFDGYFNGGPGSGGSVRSPTQIHVSPQGQVTSPKNGPYHGGDPLDFYEDSWIPSRDCWARWGRVIPALFTGWDALPDPHALTAAVDELKYGTHRLFQQSGIESDGSVTPGNGQLSDIGYLNDELSLFDGDAMRAFHRYYTSQLPNVVSGQGALAHALYFGLAAEQQVWSRARIDVAEIATQAIGAMKAAHPSGDGGSGWGTFFKVLGAVAAAATIVVTDGAAAPFVGGAATAIGIVGSFVEDPDAKQKKKVPLGGSTPGDVSDNIEKALQKLNDAIVKEEGKISDASSRVVNESYGDRASFNLLDAVKARTKTDFLRSHDGGSIASAPELRVHLKTLRELATSVIPNIARQLDDARKDVSRADRVSLWERPAGIGLDSTYSVWAELEWHLDNVLQDTSWELHAAAHHMEIVVADFGKTDGQVDSDLAADTRRVRAGSGAYTGPPQPVGHGPVHAI